MQKFVVPFGAPTNAHPRRESRTGGDADKDPFLAGKFLAPTHGLCIFDAKNLAGDLHVYGIPCQLRNEVRAPALQRVRAPRGVTRRSRSIRVPLLLNPA